MQRAYAFMIDDLYLKPKRNGLPALPHLVRTLLTLALAALFAASCALTAAAQADNGITQPLDGETVSGVVVVTGTAVHPDYLRYELSFRYVSSPTADWIVFAEGSEPVNQGTLAVWDTTVGRDVGSPVFPDGRYQLRLRVVRTDYNYDEYFVSDLIVANDTPVEATPTGTAPAESTPAVPEAGQTAVFQQPTPLPSLTPFPTPTTPAVSTNSAASPAATITSEGSGGVLDSLAAVEVGRFGRAFWLGVRVTGLLFAALAGYLLLRGLFRWIWRWAWRQKNQRNR